MIKVGDCLELARDLPDSSVDCIITSPPYWGLRDYGNPDAWGLEPTLAEYLARLGALFEELRRALKPTGTCWLNLGDAYAGSWGAQSRPNGNDVKSNLQGGSMLSARQISEAPKQTHTGSSKRTGLKPKDLIGLPWRVAFMLQEAGWYLRSDIVWAKPNPMPESVTDRPTRAHEYVFLLTKSAKYTYDADAIREPAKSDPESWKMADGWDTGPGGHGIIHRNGREKGARPDKQRGHGRRHEGFNDRWDAMSRSEQMANGANARSVWTIATQPFSEAHFATFPPELPKRCIIAGCPVGGLVLDPFAGSGTTGMVAKQLGRQFLGFEINTEYAAMAERRIAAARWGVYDQPRPTVDRHTASLFEGSE